MRKEYEMSKEDLDKLQKACRPVPYMVIGGVPPSSQQENANRAWQRLAKKMGFKWNTARPVEGKGMEFFTAEPDDAETRAGG